MFATRHGYRFSQLLKSKSYILRTDFCNRFCVLLSLDAKSLLHLLCCCNTLSLAEHTHCLCMTHSRQTGGQVTMNHSQASTRRNERVKAREKTWSTKQEWRCLVKLFWAKVREPCTDGVSHNGAVRANLTCKCELPKCNRFCNPRANYLEFYTRQPSCIPLSCENHNSFMFRFTSTFLLRYFGQLI